MGNYSTLFSLMFLLGFLVMMVSGVIAFKCGEAKIAEQMSWHPAITGINLFNMYFNPLTSCAGDFAWINILLIVPIAIIFIITIVSFIPLVGGPG